MHRRHGRCTGGKGAVGCCHPWWGGCRLNRFLRGISLYLLLAIIAVSIVSSLYPTQERRQEVTYSQFMQCVQDNRIAQVTIIGEQLVEGQLQDGSLFSTFIPVGTTNLGSMLIERGVQVSAQREPQPPFWMSLLPHLLTIGIFIVLWLF